MTEFVQERIAAGFNTAGVVVIIERAPIGRIINDLLSLIDRIDEWENTFWFVPLTK
jgi:hypothetical protein